MVKKDYYLILGIKRTASLKEIKSVYRKLSNKIHPDKNDGDKYFEEYFKEIGEAYEVLSNEDKRRKYDQIDNDNTNILESEIRLLKDKNSRLEIEIKDLQALISNKSIRIKTLENLYNPSEIKSLKDQIFRLEKETQNLKSSITEKCLKIISLEKLLIESKEKNSQAINEYPDLAKRYNKLVDQYNALGNKTNWKAWLWFGVLLLLFLTNSIDFSKGEKQNLKQQVTDLNTTLNSQSEKNQLYSENERNLQNKVNDLQKKINQITIEAPFLISGIEFYNSTNPDFSGKYFYKDDIRYLSSKLKIIPISESNMTIQLNIKMIRPDGAISRNSSISPIDYTYSQVYNYSPSSELISLKGWGSETGGAYVAGKYKVEIYQNDKFIYAGSFMVY
jgi:curved DNA-binding protein CbpA